MSQPQPYSNAAAVRINCAFLWLDPAPPLLLRLLVPVLLALLLLSRRRCVLAGRS
jgi:hypothetical protein